MQTTSPLARVETIDAVLDEIDAAPAYETRAARPAAPATPGAPAAPIADPIAQLAGAIDRQTAAFETRARRPAPLPANRTTTPSALRTRVEQTSQTPDEARARQTLALREAHEDDLRDRQRGRPDILHRERRQRVLADIDASEGAELREMHMRITRLERENRMLRRPSGPDLIRRDAGANGRLLAFRTALLQHMRTGEEVFNGVHLRELQRRAQIDIRAVNTQDNTSGGYFVQPERDDGPIEKLLKQISPMRSLATIRSISAAQFEKPVNLRGQKGRWVGEGEPSTTDDTSQFGLLKFPALSMLAEPEVTLESLEDMSIDLESLLAEEAQDTFAEMEGSAFWSGNGVSRPRGLLTYDMVANSNWSWGKIGYIATGASGAFAASAGSVGPGDVIKKTPLLIKQALRQGASWIMNRGTMGEVRTIKDSTGRYLWADGDMSKGIPNTLDGYVVNEDEQAPDIAADSFAIGFGDWRRTYLIVDRLGFHVIRNPYINAPNVRFHMRKRVGGGVQNFEAPKFIKFGTN